MRRGRMGVCVCVEEDTLGSPCYPLLPPHSYTYTHTHTHTYTHTHARTEIADRQTDTPTHTHPPTHTLPPLPPHHTPTHTHTHNTVSTVLRQNCAKSKIKKKKKTVTKPEQGILFHQVSRPPCAGVWPYSEAPPQPTSSPAEGPLGAISLCPSDSQTRAGLNA